MKTNNELRVGGLALVVRANHPENIGKVVTILDLTSELSIYFRDETGFLRNCDNPMGKSAAVIQCDTPITVKDHFGVTREVFVNACTTGCLMPLDGGEFEPEEEAEDVLLSVSN